MNYPKVSILMISFNQAEFVGQALDSVISQEFQDWELICVDPGSTDGSRQIIEGYAKRSDRIKLIFEPDNGPADGLNKALHLAKGEIVGCLNSDDLYTQGTFSKIYRIFHTKAKPDCIFGNGFILREGQISVQTSDRFNIQRYFEGIALVMQQSTFFRREALLCMGIQFNVTNRTCWDGEILLDCALAKLNIVKCKDFFGIFRIHEKSITGTASNLNQYLIDQQRMYRKAFKDLDYPRKPKLLMKTYAFYRRTRNLRYITASRKIKSDLKNLSDSSI